MSPDTAFVKEWCRIDGAEFDIILPKLIATATTLACHETGVDYLSVGGLTHSAPVLDLGFDLAS